MEKREINTKTTVTAIITGFVSYGIIVLFISWIILLIANSVLNNFHGSSSRGLYITLPLMAVLIIYCIIHMLCRISTYDVFKKCKTNPENYRNIDMFLNIFFVAVIIISMIAFLGLLSRNLKYQQKSIEYATVQYKQVFSESHINTLVEEMNTNYNDSRINLTISTVILEIGCAVSFLSLIPYQKEMISKYNQFN